MTDAHLFRDDVPAFLRSWTNNSVLHVIFSPQGRHYVTEGAKPALKNVGELNGNGAGWPMRNYRNLLVLEIGGTLWLAKATPRHWLAQGRTISAKNAPTYFGTVGYEIVSAVDDGAINATVDMPARNAIQENAIQENAPKEIVLRFRHPMSAPIKGVTVNGKS